MQISRYSGGLFLAIALLAILPARASDKKNGDILAAPRPGDEYVLFRSGPPKQRSAEEVEEANLNLGSNSALLGVLTGSILSPADTLPIFEVQTEVSVVTSKEVLVGGRPVAPLVEVASMSDTGRRTVSNAEEEERKILERKAKAGKKKAPATVVVPVPALVLGAAEGVGKAVEVVPEAIKGVQSPKFEPKEGEIGVPPQKAIEGTTPSPGVQPLTTLPPEPFRGDLVAVNLLNNQNVGSSSGGLFGPNSGSEKMSLEPAASNQASRVNVKKGPSGEDYEYEYVYYYYDDDDKEKDGKGTATGNKDTSAIFEDVDDDSAKDEDNETPPKAPPSTSTTTSTTTTTTTTTTTERPTTEAPRSRVRGRGGSGTRSRFHVKNQQHQEEEEEVSSEEEDSSEVVPERGFGRQRGRGDGAGSSDGNRNRFRYTTIERNRGASEAAEASVGNKIRGTVPVIEEAVPASNEVGGSRGGPRYRSRAREQSAATAAPAEPIAEERLPSNTRFPPRSRSRVEDSSSATEPIQRVPAATPASPPRGAVRPSLELVDSSSFRTNAGGASPDQDLAAPTFPAVPSGAPVKFLGVNAEGGEEEEDEDTSAYHEDTGKTGAKRTKVRTEPVSTTPTPTVQASVEPTYAQDIDDETVSSTLPAAVEKSVFDLYAILQAQDNASNLVSTEEGEDASSEVSTTPQDGEETTTTQQPTTTTLPTTTTIQTTTTTTTTTTQAPTTERTNGRPKFRGRGNGQQPAAPGGRGRYRRPDGSTTTTTEAPSSEAAPSRPRTRFNANRNGGGGGGRGSYGRRSTTTQSAPLADEPETEEEKPATRQFSRPSLSRTPGNRFRGRAGAGPSTSTESAPQEGGVSSSTTLLARPTFADRYNLRRRVGISTTTASTPAADDNEEGHGERATGEAAEASPAPAAETPGRLPRPRVRPPGSLSPRPLRPGPRINLAGRARPGQASLPATSSTAAAEEAADVVQDEAASETHSAAEEHEEGEDGEDKAAVTTPIPGPLTRLRNRPRLRVTERVSTARPAQASAAGRKQLVSSLLPRRRPGQASTAAPAATEEEGGENSEEADDHKEDASEGEDDVAPTTPGTSTTAHEERGLAGLLAGRKRTRRPGTLFSGRPQPQANQES